MRTASAISVFLLAAALSALVCAAEADKDVATLDVPGIPKGTRFSPDAAVRAAAFWVATNDDWVDGKGKKVKGHGSWLPCDARYIRFLSLHDLPTRAEAMVKRRLLSWWLHQMSFNPHVQALRSVPGTSDRVVWVDMRDYRWNAAAWRAAAERELYMLDGISVDHEVAEYLRRRLVAPLSDQALRGREVAVGQGRVERKALLPVGAVVTATQFMRDTMETDRSDSYYDLLFAEYRFTDIEVEGGAAEHASTRKVKKKALSVPLVPDSPKLYADRGDGYSAPLTPGKEFPAGKKVYTWSDGAFHAWAVPPPKEEESVEVVSVKTRVLPRGRIASKFTNFPKDTADWEKAFGVDKVRAHLRDRKIDVDFGAVVEGGKDDPKNGSMVSLQNRLLVTVVGPYGAAMETFDVLETSGLKDFTESLIFKGEKYDAGSGARAVRDAGELLAYLPNGGQAGLLVDGKGNRQEFAGNNVAEDGGSTTKDKRVRNVGSCVVCHAPDGGYIMPRDVIGDGKSKGLLLKFKDRDQENRVHAFFKDQADRVKSYTLPYAKLIEETTRPIQADPKAKPLPGWTGVLLAKEVERFRREYDAPLNLAQAAAEVGMPEKDLIVILDQLPLLRAQMLIRGKPVPRRTWEKDIWPNIHLIRQLRIDETERAKKGK